MIAKITSSLFSILFLASASYSGQFSADIRMVQHGNVMAGKIYVLDSTYRLDMAGGQSGIYVTVNEKIDSAMVVNPAASQYMVMPVTNPQIIKTDPIQTARMLLALGAIKNYQGVDTLGGRTCDAYIYLREGKPSLEVWVARDVDFPIRVSNPEDTANYMELVNIEIAAQPESLFAVPAGFVQRERPQREPSPDAPPPRVVQEGTKLRIPLNPRRVAVIALINTAEGESDCRLTFFANGVQIPDSRTGGDELCTFHLAAQGDKDGHAYDTQADEVLVEVTRGAVAVDINQ